MCTIQDPLSLAFPDHRSELILLNSSALDLRNKQGTKTYTVVHEHNFAYSHSGYEYVCTYI